MKKIILKIAILVAMLTACTGIAVGQNPPPPPPDKPPLTTIEILIKEILLPENPGPRSVYFPYSVASIDIDMGNIYVEFSRKVENISITVSHSSFGILDMVTMDYDYQSWIAIPVPVEDGTYTIIVTGDNYQAIGYFDNY